MEFHVNRKARERYRLHDTFFSIRGNVIFADFKQAQLFAEQFNNEKRIALPETQELITPAYINAMGLLHELIHDALAIYREEINPEAYSRCEQWLIEKFGKETLDGVVRQTTELFPPVSVYKQEKKVDEYLTETTDGMPNRFLILEELILIWLQNQNPALKPVTDLIDDTDLKRNSSYLNIINQIQEFFATQPAFGPDNLPLISALLEPLRQSPDSLMEQLAFIQQRWGIAYPRLKQHFAILQAMDFIKEEGKYFLFKQQAETQRAIQPNVQSPIFHGFGGERESPPVPIFPGKTTTPEAEAEPEPEQFSADLSWMPRLILIAKNAFVWLDQLSKKYARPITRLDQIPDEELDKLASFGITGLWLIGIWKRSQASRRIKHLHGNIDAEASAYSLDDYNISDELGGYDAYQNLRERARYRGLRLACDMVPNHMGMDSQWVMQHPDWFLQSDVPPYPNYTFNGPDLSNNDRIGIYLEDGYWRRADAAVVFKRLDRYTGDVKYLYHGNDGTNMPWNDTAQLNFMKQEVREAVIQTILHVARMFPVIRFDAAMVLAKKHYQRLWFPQPGTGGAVPSRAQFALTKEQFDAMMPAEFWREVVDRVQQEVPDTLLLAEAFWLMEGYFVRTLGMHRVYNSAFMHMLKKEENANFKQSIKNVLEYNPGILKRHVNFMSNPDEETAIAQFGSHDKYFGVCILMITLPGLPMFGHGQIEGFKEKYGMEYRRAYYDEQPDYHLMYRHDREITPLLKKRYIFAEVENFQLYDCFDTNGLLNDNVFAFTNSYGSERALVIYNNGFEHAEITIRPEAAKQFINEKEVTGFMPDALGISPDRTSYYILRDLISHLEFLRPANEFYQDGLHFSLDGYTYHVFLEFMHDTVSQEKRYDILAERLQGRGVHSIADEIAHLRLEPLHALIRGLLTQETLATLQSGRKNKKTSTKALRVLETSFNEMLNTSRGFDTKFLTLDNKQDDLKAVYGTLLKITSAETISSKSFLNNEWKELIARHLSLSKSEDQRGWHVIIIWMCIKHINGLRQTDSDIINDWKLERVILQAFGKLSGNTQRQQRDFDLVKLLTTNIVYRELHPRLSARLNIMLSNPIIERFIGINQWQDDLYFSKEQFEELLDWVTITLMLEMITRYPETKAQDLGTEHSATTTVLQPARSMKKAGNELPQQPLPILKKENASIQEQLADLFEESVSIKESAEYAGYKFEDFVELLGKKL